VSIGAQTGGKQQNISIAAIDRDLFNRQGNVTRRGFVLLSDAQARERVPPEHVVAVAFRSVLLIEHPGGSSQPSRRRTASAPAAVAGSALRVLPQ
jgi:hypothetical protein